jgi:predicted ATP-dependent endonuclease of OLD family
MKLTKLIITGYRSVKRQETLFVDDRVTILIGANDHGKSNLLAAIECLNDEKQIAPDDKNWDAEHSKVELRWHFFPTEPERDHLATLALTGRSILPPEGLRPPQTDEQSPPVESAQEQVKSKSSAELKSATKADGSLDPSHQSDLGSEPRVQDASLAPPASVSSPGPTFPVDEKGQIIFARDSETNKVTVAALPFEIEVSNADAVLALRPRVEFFESPRGNVIDQVNLKDLETPQYEFMQGIFRLGGLWDGRKDIFTQNVTTSKLLDEASERLTKVLNDEWNQGKELRWKLKHTGTNGDHIVMEIEDPAIRGRYTRPSLRSSGFRTFFLMSMIVYARTQKGPSYSSIYLFDEPGTYLHPHAQMDLQRSFEVMADFAQIVYTTHSLFLVSKNYPTRNRVVSKGRDGTKIDQKPFTKNWKSVRASLGILLSNNFLIAEKTLLVEGPSDVIYILTAMRRLKGEGRVDIDLNDISIVDSGSSQNYIAMAKLMLSEGREVVALLDGEEGGRKLEGQLKNVCAKEVKSKKLQVHMLPGGKSSEDVFANLDVLRNVVRVAFDSLVEGGHRKAKENLKIEDEVQKLAPAEGRTLGKVLDEVSTDWFNPPEKISKLLIAMLYEEASERDVSTVPGEAEKEVENIKEELKLRGERAKEPGVFEEVQ